MKFTTYLWILQARKEKRIVTHASRIWPAVLCSPQHRARAMCSSLLLWRKLRPCSRASETRQTNAPTAREAGSWRAALAQARSEAASLHPGLSRPLPTRENRAGGTDSFEHLKTSEGGILIVHKSISDKCPHHSSWSSLKNIPSIPPSKLYQTVTAILKPAWDVAGSSPTY